MKHAKILFILMAVCITTGFSQGIMGGLKKKAAQLSEKALEKKVEEKTGINQGSTPAGPTPSSNGNRNASDPSNKGGGGLIMTPPDVKQQMADAETAYKASQYSDAKHALQQAMQGVEMEMGKEVLKSFPESVAGLPKEDGTDQVTSTGWGWAGLTIHQEYRKGDKELQVTVANNSVMMAAVNMYLSNSAYSQSGQQNWKQIKIQDNRGIIEYSEGSGYKISVPIGQSSIIIWQGINFASEQDISAATNAFSISNIKSKLGEK